MLCVYIFKYLYIYILIYLYIHIFSYAHIHIYICSYAHICLCNDVGPTVELEPRHDGDGRSDLVLEQDKGASMNYRSEYHSEYHSEYRRNGRNARNRRKMLSDDSLLLFSFLSFSFQDSCTVVTVQTSDAVVWHCTLAPL